MEKIKQIIYREEDHVLMIIPTDLSIEIIPRYTTDLSNRYLTTFNEMRDYLLTKISSIKYITYIADDKSLHVQSNEDSSKVFDQNNINSEEKTMINSYTEALCIICEDLLNS